MSFAAKLYVSADPRRSDRRIADIDGTLRGRGGAPIDVHVVDISRHGFRCLTTADLRAGDSVTIGLRGSGNGSAIVRWRRGAQIGCEFVVPLTEAQTLAAIAGDVVVSPPQWSEIESSASNAALPVISPLRLFATLLGIGLVVDLLNVYLNRVP